jgi:hypothetical protein
VTVQCEGVADILAGNDRARCQPFYFDQYPDGRDRAKDPDIVYVRVPAVGASRGLSAPKASASAKPPSPDRTTACPAGRSLVTVRAAHIVRRNGRHRVRQPAEYSASCAFSVCAPREASCRDAHLA